MSIIDYYEEIIYNEIGFKKVRCKRRGRENIKKERVTIYDIAEEAKVSPSTVSRVLTGSARVHPETMKKVEKIIKKYNFRPNSLARSLLHKQSKMIGFVLPDINHPFFSTLVLKSEAHALKLGYTSFLCNSMDDADIESAYLQNLIDKQVDGIIFLGGRINSIEQTPQYNEYVEEMKQVMDRVPLVLINGQMSGLDAHTIHTDEESGIDKLVELLVNHGHSKIGFLGGLETVTSTIVKRRAFSRALEKHGLSVNHEWIITGDFSIESGEVVAARLLDQKEKPTAVVCVNDFVAIGVIKMFSKFGLKVPEDISVTGFDDIYLAEHFPPGITTISQNYDLLGEVAVNILVDLIDGKKVEAETVIPTSLVIRSSCNKRNY